MHAQGDRARALLVLGLNPDASVAEVEAAYRRLVRRYHPDRTGTAGSTEQLAAVVEARRIVQSPAPPPANEPPSGRPVAPPRRRTAAVGPPIVAGPVRYTPAPPGKGA